MHCAGRSFDYTIPAGLLAYVTWLITICCKLVSAASLFKMFLVKFLLFSKTHKSVPLKKCSRQSIGNDREHGFSGQTPLRTQFYLVIVESLIYDCEPFLFKAIKLFEATPPKKYER